MNTIEEDLARRARRALHHWNLPDQLPQLLKYRENAVFRVSRSDGTQAALRLHRPGYHSRAALASELAWMADLQKSGFRVPEPALSQDGEFLLALETDDSMTQYADLIGWVDGEPLGESGRSLGRSPEELRVVFGSIGQAMARMHLSGDRFAIPGGFERPSWNADGLLGEKPFWGRFWDCDSLEPVDRIFLTSLREDLRERLASIAGTLDQGLIHADLVRENVMVHDGNVAFIDFDDCGFGFRLFDLATTLLRNRKEAYYAVIQDSLLNGYSAVRPDLAAEYVHLPLFLLLRSLTYIGWAASRREMPDSNDRLIRYVADVRDLASRL